MRPRGSLVVDVNRGAATVGTVYRSREGDGTVPLVSAEFRSSTPVRRHERPVEHAQCFNERAFRARTILSVRRVLAGELPADNPDDALNDDSDDDLARTFELDSSPGISQATV